MARQFPELRLPNSPYSFIFVNFLFEAVRTIRITR